MGAYSVFTDQQLTYLLKQGDHLAYTQLYERYWALLYIHARKMLRDRDEAMDIVQDIYTILWDKREELKEESNVRAYLYMAARNHTLNHINRGKLKEKYLSSLADFVSQGALTTEEEVCYRDFAQCIEKEIAAFPPKMKQIFEMSRNAGMSNQAIADQLGITDHAVKKSINRALKVLKTQIRFFFTF